MSYKIGMYKLNLGLDEVQKMQLEYIQGVLGVSNFSKTIRIVLQQYYDLFLNEQKQVIPRGYVLVKKVDLDEIKSHLENCYLLQKKSKEVKG